MSAIETLTSEVQRLQNAVDWWNNVGLVFTAIIAIGAVGYYWASKKTFNMGAQLREAHIILANAQEEQLRRDLKDKDVTIAYLQKAVTPRMLDHKVFLEALKGKPKAKVEILYKPDDEEAYMLATQINRWLGNGAENDGAAWEVIEPRALTNTDVIEGWMDSSTVPLATKCGVLQGLGLVVKHIEFPSWDEKGKPIGPTSALTWALINAGVGCSSIVPNPNLPDNLIRIVIGSKM